MHKYQILYDAILEQIPEMLRRGERRLPTEAQLCTAYGVSRQTVRSALAALEEKGIITRRQGSGAYLTGAGAGSARNQAALLLESDTLYTYPFQIREASRYLTGEGLEVAIYTTEGDPDRERQILQVMADDPPAGIIWDCHRAYLPTPNRDLIAALSAAKVPLVFLHGYPTNLPPYLNVTEDERQGAYDLTEHLIRLGHRRIACLLEADSRGGQEKYYGFTCACRDNGLPFGNALTVRYLMRDLASDAHRRAGILADMMRHVTPGVTAVVCQNDECAWYLGQALTKARLRIPEDISIAAFDHSYIRQVGQATLTTMSSGREAISLTAARLLVRRLKGQHCESIVRPFTLVPGASTASPAAGR